MRFLIVDDSSTMRRIITYEGELFRAGLVHDPVATEQIGVNRSTVPCVHGVVAQQAMLPRPDDRVRPGQLVNQPLWPGGPCVSGRRLDKSPPSAHSPQQSLW